MFLGCVVGVFPIVVPPPVPRPPPLPPVPPPPPPGRCANTLVETDASKMKKKRTLEDLMAGTPLSNSIGPFSAVTGITCHEFVNCTRTPRLYYGY
jgi:hypothetical protein